MSNQPRQERLRPASAERNRRMEDDTMPDDALGRALRLAKISLGFGRVGRATLHEDGVRVETDTDHTVMLCLVACELAPPHLDRTKVAAFAAVHDLAEVYAGDTQTLTISDEGMVAKRAREDAARSRLVSELGPGSWVAETLSTYELQTVPEARFVRLIDKVLPKLTHAFNRCAAATKLTDRKGFIGAHEKQLRRYSDEYPEFPEAIELLRASMLHAEEQWPPEEASARSSRAAAQARHLVLREAEVKAVLAGETVTVACPVGLKCFGRSSTPGHDWTWRGTAPVRSLTQQSRSKSGVWQDVRDDDLMRLCPYGPKGGVLWVREAWRPDSSHDPADTLYLADVPPDYPEDVARAIRWSSATSMPRVRSRMNVSVRDRGVALLHDVLPGDGRAWDGRFGRSAPWATNPWVFWARVGMTEVKRGVAT